MAIVRGAGKQARAIAACAVTLVLLACAAAHLVHGFAFVPVIQSFAKAEKSGSRAQSRLMCQQGGGYVAAEATAALHESVITTARAAGAGDTWYAFLAGDTEANEDLNCKQAITIDPSSGRSYGCYWRWNQGRWTEMEDGTTLPLYKSGVGVTFYVGNTYMLPTSATITVYGQVSGFPTYFTQDPDAGAVADRRPGMLFGQSLIAVGAKDTSTWSDNVDSGGYGYAGYTYNRFVGRSTWNATDIEASKANFWAVCQAQAPSRTMYEMTNTSSGLQQNWWVIFFVILFVLTLVAFIIIAACQDDEDMDEPPEDAPEWAQNETQETKRTKSFVSTRSFRGNNEDEDDYNNGNNNARRGSRGGSTSSEGSSGDSFQGRRRSSDDGYRQEQPQPQQQQQQQPRAVSSAANSNRHLGRQNGSSYNMQQPQYAPNNGYGGGNMYVDNNNYQQQGGYVGEGNYMGNGGNQAQNNWM